VPELFGAAFRFSGPFPKQVGIVSNLFVGCHVDPSAKYGCLHLPRPNARAGSTVICSKIKALRGHEFLIRDTDSAADAGLAPSGGALDEQARPDHVPEGVDGRLRVTPPGTSRARYGWRRMRNIPVYLTLAMAVALISAAALLLGMPSDEAKAGKKVTTEQAAATAGARVSPTEPKLRVEPK
jgi:hypothetical protein